MRLPVILRYVCLVLLLNAVFLFLSSLISLLYHDDSFFPLIYSTVLCLLFGIFPLIFIPPIKDVTSEEGLIIIVCSWLLSCTIGAIPYVLWGGEFSFTNAWFESVSGYTTTGSTVLLEIESLPHGLLFWRSTTHWIGGIGIILFVLAVLPYIGIPEVALYKAEISAFAREKLNFRTRKAVQVLLVVYVGLTLLETVFLLAGGMSLYDAVVHSFATIATGGFSPRNASVAYYDSVYIEVVIIVFMVLSGLNFAVLYTAILGKVGNLLSSTAFKYYLTAMAVGILICAIYSYHAPYESLGESLRQSAFQVVSIGTSTGFATTDTTLWPPIAQLILIFFTLQCACTGSTSGGIKADRVAILGKSIFRMLRKTAHPLAIIHVRMDGKVVDDEVVNLGILYIAVYLLIVFIVTLVLTAMGVDLYSAFSGSAACMGNVGPGFGTVGSIGNFHHIPEAGKWVLSLAMLLGRLEIYGIIFLLMPRGWK
ncbi:MAG: TrkH family potassium uptake protein [Planctomycetota bacterium]